MPLIDDLETLISFPTVSNRPIDALASWVADRFEHHGFRVERFAHPTDASKYNLLVSIGPQGTDGLVLSGHMDVVPTEGQPWSSDPFALNRRGDRLYGRGTADMKGFLAATLAAVSRIDSKEYVRELVGMWTYDEEVGCLGSAQMVRSLQIDPRQFPSACLIGEPTGFQILRAHPGHVGLSVVIKGAAAHSSRPDLGANAIEATAAVIGAIQQVRDELITEQQKSSLLERPWVALNIARVTGGNAVNIVPDHTVLEVGYRPLPGMADEEVFERLGAAVAMVSLPRGTTAHLAIDRITPAMLTDPGTPLEALLEPHSCGKVGAATFATDGGNLSKLGMKVLVFGPGDIAVAHQADEFIPVDQLHRSVDIVEQLIRQRCC